MDTVVCACLSVHLCVCPSIRLSVRVFTESWNHCLIHSVNSLVRFQINQINQSQKTRIFSFFSTGNNFLTYHLFCCLVTLLWNIITFWKKLILCDYNDYILLEEKLGTIKEFFLLHIGYIFCIPNNSSSDLIISFHLTNN